MKISEPKVVILGAGSLFFGRKAIWQMVHSPHLNRGTLALVDSDADRLAKMKKLAAMVIAHHGVALKLEASTDRRDVLADADFVILSFARDNARYRGVDVDTSAKYGIRMCSGDTIGPGGIFRAMREQPVIEAAARDILDLCPKAWVINYINPTTVHGMALARFYPQLKSLALCDAQWNLRSNYAKMADVPNDDKLVLQSAGPNHFTWLLRAEYDGQDIMPRIIAGVRRNAEGDINRQAQGGASAAKGWMNNSIGLELYEAFGVLPTVVGHTKEYVRFYQGRSMTGLDRHAALKLFEVPARQQWTANVWQRVDDYVQGRVSIGEFDTEFGADPATDVVESMAGGLGRRFFINCPNRGAVTNMADDAYLETWCDLDLNGPRPLPVGPMPRGVRGMCETVLDTHELTAEAIHRHDRSLLRRALLTDPLSSSIGDCDALLDELFERERDALPAHWYADASA